MTKEAELNALKALAKQLGPDSYVGPWIDENLLHIEHSMLIDYPLMSIGEGERIAERRISDAEMSACKIIKAACEEADKIKREANEFVNTRKDALKRLLREAANEI
jgi:hypothetical protein